MNLTYKHTGVKDGAKREDIVIKETNCSSNFKFRFSKVVLMYSRMQSQFSNPTPYDINQGDYTFGSEENTTFYVYLYDFRPPLWIIISFSQHPKLDLLQFFITFST